VALAFAGMEMCKNKIFRWRKCMTKYEVGIQEISYGSVEVEAASEDEARELALEICSEGNISWGKMDVETTTVKYKIN